MAVAFSIVMKPLIKFNSIYYYQWSPIIVRLAVLIAVITFCLFASWYLVSWFRYIICLRAILTQVNRLLTLWSTFICRSHWPIFAGHCTLKFCASLIVFCTVLFTVAHTVINCASLMVMTNQISFHCPLTSSTQTLNSSISFIHLNWKKLIVFCKRASSLTVIASSILLLEFWISCFPLLTLWYQTLISNDPIEFNQTFCIL